MLCLNATHGCASQYKIRRFPDKGFTMSHSSSPADGAALRAKLNHPIIDADGHLLEIEPVFQDYLKEVGGAEMARRFPVEGEAGRPWAGWTRMSRDERRDTRTPAAGWWGLPPDARDRATSSLAKLQHARMDDLGLDFAVLYPTRGLSTLLIQNAELRQAACRAMNTYYADQYGPYADRLTPTAIIPLHTPEEGIAELEHAVRKLGFRAICIMGQVHRPIPKVEREGRDLARYATYIDFLGMDSDYDYDPFWAKCMELKVAVGGHGSGQGWGPRRSISSYMYNHVGSFAAAGEGFCKALLMGGVPKRFPKLNFAFLEGGVGWACLLYSGFLAHWEKRNGRGIRRLDPALLDRAKLGELVAQYGDARVRAKQAEVVADVAGFSHYRPEEPNEFAASGIESAGQLKEIFERQFFFGCEADDPAVAWGFDARVNPHGARLRSILGSDIGHWDVLDMSEVLEEAFELLEYGLVNEADFSDFTCGNALRLYEGMNPDFFKGTRVEGARRPGVGL
jgi:predicted TIM-barrel fold metal-dependent hydrolase